MISKQQYQVFAEYAGQLTDSNLADGDRQTIALYQLPIPAYLPL